MGLWAPPGKEGVKIANSGSAAILMPATTAADVDSLATRISNLSIDVLLAGTASRYEGLDSVSEAALGLEALQV